jgi:ribose 5-phosphate isomerase A
MHHPDSEEQRTIYKRQAAEYAVEFVASGMAVGLGSGSTAIFAVRRIAVLIEQGTLRDIVALPSSTAVEAEARRLGIPLASQDEPPMLDITIDGADEVDEQLQCIKGGGGALLREKMLAQNSRREVIVVDQTKLSPRLGTRRALPVEVLEFAWGAQRRFLESLGATVTLRMGADGRPFRTDQGNLILDGRFGPIENPAWIASRLDSRAGIVEHGLFLGLATDLVMAGATGIRHLTASRGAQGTGHD